MSLTAVRGRLPSSGRRVRWPRRRWLVAAAWVVGVVVMYLINLRLSQTVAVDSDGATDALEALDILHGNFLLHGWMIGDVTFITTEIPEYVLVMIVHGFSPGLPHVTGAITYTLEMLLAVLLAMGPAGVTSGRQRLARAVIAAGIMLAPEFPGGLSTLIGKPDHPGTSVPLLLALVLADRLPARWPVIAATSVVLFIGQVADTTVFYVGVLPFILVCGYRAIRAAGPERRHEALLAACALAAGLAGALVPHLISAIGGYQEVPANTSLAPLGSIVKTSAPMTGLGLLLLGGADFVHVPWSAVRWFALVHLAGVALVAVAIVVAAWRFRDRDRTVQLLLVGLLLNIAAYLFGTRAVELMNAREMAAVLPFGAVLAARLLAARIVASRLAISALVLALGCYLAGMAWELRQPVAPAQLAGTAAWLEHNHLTYGLSMYWESSALTLASDNQVKLRPVVGEPVTGLQPYWEMTQRDWYNATDNDANFVLFNTTELQPGPFQGFTAIRGFTDYKSVEARFGPPARVLHNGDFTVWVYNKNLLTELPKTGLAS
jgi:hypothetical protein